ncbi:hypothetical protein METEAL_37140 [Mesoterricola silvestris]|uniref:Uncharacterized protein n=1 Tax=Mesoterricola silvestris TaxID=2927979 RepID=A0AA48KAY6_9BACT|nr:hypothetical protein METEAL_37140 [Mesoterricola silvestris]
MFKSCPRYQSKRSTKVGRFAYVPENHREAAHRAGLSRVLVSFLPPFGRAVRSIPPPSRTGIRPDSRGFWARFGPVLARGLRSGEFLPECLSAASRAKSWSSHVSNRANRSSRLWLIRRAVPRSTSAWIFGARKVSPTTIDTRAWLTPIHVAASVKSRTSPASTARKIRWARASSLADGDGGWTRGCGACSRMGPRRHRPCSTRSSTPSKTLQLHTSACGRTARSFIEPRSVTRMPYRRADRQWQP